MAARTPPARPRSDAASRSAATPSASRSLTSFSRSCSTPAWPRADRQAGLVAAGLQIGVGGLGLDAGAHGGELSAAAPAPRRGRRRGRGAGRRTGRSPSWRRSPPARRHSCAGSPAGGCRSRRSGSAATGGRRPTAPLAARLRQRGRRRRPAARRGTAARGRAAWATSRFWAAARSTMRVSSGSSKPLPPGRRGRPWRCRRRARAVVGAGQRARRRAGSRARRRRR